MHTNALGLDTGGYCCAFCDMEKKKKKTLEKGKLCPCKDIVIFLQSLSYMSIILGGFFFNFIMVRFQLRNFAHVRLQSKQSCSVYTDDSLRRTNCTESIPGVICPVLSLPPCHQRLSSQLSVPNCDVAAAAAAAESHGKMYPTVKQMNWEGLPLVREAKGECRQRPTHLVMQLTLPS